MITRGLIFVLIVILILLQTFAIDYELNYVKCGKKVLYTLIVDVPLALYILYSIICIFKLSTGTLSLQWLMYSISLAVKFYFLVYPCESFTPLDGFEHLYWANYLTHYQGYHYYFAFTPLIYILYHKLCIQLSSISVWLYEILHADLCISTTIDIWDVVSIAYKVPNMEEYKGLMTALILSNMLSLGLVLPTTGVQAKCKATDWRRNSDIFIIAKFAYLVGLFLIDIPFLTYRIYELRNDKFSILIVKNFLFIFIRSFRLAIWQLAYRDAIKWNETNKAINENDSKTDASERNELDFHKKSDTKQTGGVNQVVSDNKSVWGRSSIGCNSDRNRKPEVHQSQISRNFTRTKFHRSTLHKSAFKVNYTNTFEDSDSEERVVDVSKFNLNVTMSEYLRQIWVMCSQIFAKCYEKYISDDLSITLIKRIRLVASLNLQPIMHLVTLLTVILDCYNYTTLLILTITLGVAMFLCDFYTAPHLDVVFNTLYAVISLISTVYTIDTFWKVNSIYFKLFTIVIFSIFPFLVIVPNLMSSVGAVKNVKFACYKILIMSCRWCISPISHHGVILGKDVIKNVVLTDQVLQAHWTGVVLLIVLKIFSIALSPNWIIYIVHLCLSLSYVILSQAVRIHQQRKYEIQFLQKPMHADRPYSVNSDDELAHIGRFGLFSCPGHLLPPIL